MNLVRENMYLHTFIDITICSSDKERGRDLSSSPGLDSQPVRSAGGHGSARHPGDSSWVPTLGGRCRVAWASFRGAAVCWPRLLRRGAQVLLPSAGLPCTVRVLSSASWRSLQRSNRGRRVPPDHDKPEPSHTGSVQLHRPLRLHQWLWYLRGLDLRASPHGRHVPSTWFEEALREVARQRDRSRECAGNPSHKQTLPTCSSRGLMHRISGKEYWTGNTKRFTNWSTFVFKRNRQT